MGVVFKARHQTLLYTLEGHGNAVTSIAFSPDGKRVASGGWDVIRTWDTATGQETLSLRGHLGWVYWLAFSPTGRHLASGGWDLTVRLWNGADR